MAAKKVVKKRRVITVPQECYFCKEKKVPAYADVTVLHKFVTDRGKIVARTRSGLCAKHQRGLTSSVKHARHLALLPFVAGE
jgi:small subunit ribosomal protein S18